MQYVQFGKTSAMVSRLGFGCMRLPNYQKGDKTIFDEDKSIAMMQRAYAAGVNYYDTAPYYCDQQSEVILGKAVKDFRGNVYISTKNPIQNKSGDDYERRLEGSLKRLGMDYIDFYHFWGISYDAFINSVCAPDGPLDRARKLKEQGLIKHIAFSFHDREAGDAEGKRLVEILKRGEGVLESVLCQYNFLDQNKGLGLEYAHKHGLGTVVMGPVGGGRLGAPSEAIQKLLPTKPHSSVEVALRFVFSNPNINIALSGMSTMEQVEENIAIASNTSPLSKEELEHLSVMISENERLMELYCTGCRYCLPCPKNVNIPEIFTLMNYHRVYKLTDYAKQNYAQIGKVEWRKYENASACIECGACEKKCPQSLPIRQQLKETHQTLAS